MFESIDLQIVDDKKVEAGTSGFIVWSTRAGCTRTGCWGTTCKYPC